MEEINKARICKRNWSGTWYASSYDTNSLLKKPYFDATQTLDTEYTMLQKKSEAKNVYNTTFNGFPKKLVNQSIIYSFTSPII